MYLSLCVCLCTNMWFYSCLWVMAFKCLRDLQVMMAHNFLNFIFLVIRQKDELYILSSESVTSIKKPVNLLKVVYHPVSCLLYHYIMHLVHLATYKFAAISFIPLASTLVVIVNAFSTNIEFYSYTHKASFF